MTVKMPEPMTAPMPSAVSDHGPRVFFSRCSGSCDSEISLSIDLHAKSWFARTVLPGMKESMPQDSNRRRGNGQVDTFNLPQSVSACHRVFHLHERLASWLCWCCSRPRRRAALPSTSGNPSIPREVLVRTNRHPALGSKFPNRMEIFRFPLDRRKKHVRAPRHIQVET